MLRMKLGAGWGRVGVITFFALAHMVGSTQHHGVGWGWGGVGMITFFALAHMVGATQHHVLDQNSINLFRRLVGDEVCKERCDSYVLTAGDNCAESLCAVSKKTIETHQFEYCSGARQD